METHNIIDKEITLNRRTKIVERLETQGQVKVTDLSHLFQVSKVTIRNDLRFLEKKGLLLRARGGAVLPQRAAADYHINIKEKEYHTEKVAIGKKAAELINEGETIILDSGTTTMEIARNLFRFKKLTVITNALNIATYLTNLENIKVVIPGGILKKNSFSLVGALAETNFRNFYCDKVFLGANGVSVEHGVSTVDMEESYLNRIMIEISKEVFVVADSSKFNHRSLTFVSTIDKIHTIITDNNLPEMERDKLRSLGVLLLTV